VVVLYDVIYNFQELPKRLDRSGHRFATRSDTEVTAHLYEAKGPALVHELGHMFAFASWDASSPAPRSRAGSRGKHPRPDRSSMSCTASRTLMVEHVPDPEAQAQRAGRLALPALAGQALPLGRRELVRPAHRVAAARRLDRLREPRASAGGTRCHCTVSMRWRWRSRRRNPRRSRSGSAALEVTAGTVAPAGPLSQQRRALLRPERARADARLLLAHAGASRSSSLASARTCRWDASAARRSTASTARSGSALHEPARRRCGGCLMTPERLVGWIKSSEALARLIDSVGTGVCP
jgi:Glutamine amidotransferase domain